MIRAKLFLYGLASVIFGFVFFTFVSTVFERVSFYLNRIPF